jgi:hypothetical protein
MQLNVSNVMKFVINVLIYFCILKCKRGSIQFGRFDGPGYKSRQGQIILFFFFKDFKEVLGFRQPPFQWVPGFFPGRRMARV